MKVYKFKEPLPKMRIDTLPTPIGNDQCGLHSGYLANFHGGVS